MPQNLSSGSIILALRKFKGVVVVIEVEVDSSSGGGGRSGGNAEGASRIIANNTHIHLLIKLPKNLRQAGARSVLLDLRGMMAPASWL